MISKFMQFNWRKSMEKKSQNGPYLLLSKYPKQILKQNELGESVLESSLCALFQELSMGTSAMPIPLMHSSEF